MKILAIYKYYWPDTTPYARILKGILERWVEDGHEAHVISAQPGYNDISHPSQPSREIINGVQVRRLGIVREVKRNPLLRALSFISFLGKAFWVVCFGPKFDLIIINPHPPIFMGLTVRLIKLLRGIPYLYHCEDIHPESSVAARTMKNGWLAKFLRWLDVRNCRDASLVVTLSEDMAGTMIDRGISGKKVPIINNYILGDDEQPPAGPSILEKVIGGSESNFILLFAGNIGRYQGLDHFIHTARITSSNSRIKFLFMGEGAAKEGLMNMAGDMVGDTVFFCPYQPLPEARRAMAEAHLSLVSLEPGVYRVAYPSKTMNCLASGSPILAIVENESSLARDIVENELGYCCRQGDYESTAESILDAFRRRDEWRAAGPGISAWAEEQYGKKHILDKWSEIPSMIAGRKAGN